MKSRLFLLFLLSTICVEIISQAPSRSILTEEWKVGGIFYGRTPQEEILSARTEFTKKFDRGNGLVDVYFGGPFHYKDKNGFLQDISLNIKLMSQGVFSFVNDENNFVSRFSNTHSNGVQMERNGNVVSFGLNTKIFSGNWSAASNSNLKAVINDNKIYYPHIYNNIDIEYEVNTESIKQQVLFKDRSVFEDIPAGQQYFSVQEKIILPQQSVLSDRDGIIMGKRNINGDLLVSLNNEIIYTIKESFIWDASFKGNPDEQKYAADIIDSFKPVLTSVELLSADTILLTTYVPVTWLISPQRVFPIILDPTVGIGNQSSFNSSYRYPFNTCRQQRVSQILFRKSDINAGGINTTGTITDIAFFQNTPVPLAINNLQVKMQEVAWTEMTTPTLTSSGFTTVYGPSTQTFTSGSNTWRTLSLATPFSFTNTRNLLIEARFANSTFTPGCNCDNTAPGGYWGWYNAPYAGHRWAYSNSATPPPSGASCEYNNSPERNPAYGYFIPATRITINTTGGCVPITFTTQPQAQSVVAPAQAQFSVSITGTTPVYQWQRSTDGGATWANVSGAAYSGATTNQLTINPTNGTMNGDRFRCRVTNSCSNPSPATSGQAVLTVNAAGCVTILTPAASPNIPAAGGTGSFSINVTPNTCSWSASENQSWLTIISPLNGTGDATLNYSVTANTGGPRSAAITVNGQIHTVNQLGAAAPTTYTISGRVIETGSTGLPGVTISTMPNQGSAITDAQGYYTINVPLSYTGTVRPALAPYTFTPLSLPVSSSSYNNKDFDADGVTFGITNSVIPPWQREADDYNGSISVSIVGTTTRNWHIEADVYNASNVHMGNVQFGSTTNNTSNFSASSSAAIGTPQRRLFDLSRNGYTVKYAAVFDANTSIQEYPGNSTKIIERKWDRKNLVYYNNTTNDLNIPIKWTTSLPIKIKFSILNNTGRKSLGLSAGLQIKNSNGSDFITTISNGYFIIDPNNSNIKQAFPADYKYEMFDAANILIEEGTFDLTKIGRINAGTNSNKILVVVGGIFNEMESSAISLGVSTFVFPPSDPRNAENINSDLSYSVIEYCRKNCSSGFSSWYIAQGNGNYIIRNGYDLGIALQEIAKLNPSVSEINILCHSKGGLDTRALLAGYNISMRGSPRFDFADSAIAQKVKKVVFFDSPHKGAQLANSLVQFIPLSILINIPGAIDLMQMNNGTIATLNTMPMPSGIHFFNIIGYREFENSITNMSDQVVKVLESEDPGLFTPLFSQAYQHDARKDCSPNSFCNTFPHGVTDLFHMMVHKNIFLNYKGSQHHQAANCTETKSNLIKVKEFLDASFPYPGDFNCSSTWFHYYTSLYGSSVTGATVYIKTTDNTYRLKPSGENGNVFFNTKLILNNLDSFLIMPNGYDPIRMPITTSKNAIALFKTASAKIINPSFSLINQIPYINQPSIQIKISGQNVFQYFINQHSSDSTFIPLSLVNNIATIPLDTGCNKVIIKFIGVDTVLLEKMICYFPDILINDFTYNFTINTIQTLSNSKLYVDDQFYCTLNTTNKTVKLPIGISELKFSRSGYKDTLLTVNTPGTLNLSMTPYSYSSLTDSSIFNFNNRPNPQYWKTITIKNMTSISNRQLSVKQYDDPFTGMSLKPQTRKFAFRRMGATSEAAYYKTAIALDQVNTPDKDSVYLLSIKGNRYIKYLPNVSGVTEYDPEVQKMEFDKLDFTSNSTHEIVLMQKQPPVMKPMDTIWHSGQTLVFPISMFVQDPDSIKNDITASSNDAKVVVNGNLVYVTAPVNFVGTTSFTLTGTHDWIDRTQTYTMKVIPPEVFLPTGFTPNNDGRNDVIRPVFMGKLLYCHFSVYNRYGQKVFETRDCLEGWDGKIKGIAQSSNTYVYYLTYKFEGVTESEKKTKGYFTLIR